MVVFLVLHVTAEPPGAGWNYGSEVGEQKAQAWRKVGSAEHMVIGLAPIKIAQLECARTIFASPDFCCRKLLDALAKHLKLVAFSEIQLSQPTT